MDSPFPVDHIPTVVSLDAFRAAKRPPAEDPLESIISELDASGERIRAALLSLEAE